MDHDDRKRPRRGLRKLKENPQYSCPDRRLRSIKSFLREKEAVQAEDTQEEAFGFVQTYFKRWSIEQLFKEIKSWFQFEKFKITSLEGIQKYLHLVILIHTLFAGKHAEIEHIPKLKRIIQCILKAKRNITKFTLIGLKLLASMLSFTTFLKSIKRLLYEQNLSLSYRFL